MRRSVLLLPLLVVGLLGFGSFAQEEFQAEFHNDVIENAISEFEYWNEIQTSEVDRAVYAYLNGPDIQQYASQEVAEVYKIVARGNMFGVAAEVHERSEVFEYLKAGYSLEDIGNGTAYTEHRPYAHAVARYKELRLYQFWYVKLFGDNPPAMKACLSVSPVLKIFYRDMKGVEITKSVMFKFFNGLRQNKDIVMSEDYVEGDVEKCMRLFEETGFDYGDQREAFLRRGQIYLKNHQ